MRTLRRAAQRLLPHPASDQCLSPHYLTDDEWLTVAGTTSGSGRSGESGGRTSADGFRSEALQLEVRLAEGLQKLQDAESESGDDLHSSARRLELCRTLFDRIIERDAPFGRLLERVKREYESALQVRPALPQLVLLHHHIGPSAVRLWAATLAPKSSLVPPARPGGAAAR